MSAEKSCGPKTGQKMDFTGVKIAWVDIKFIEYPYFIYEIDQHKKIEHSGWFWESNTHAYQRHPRIFKNSWKISNAYSPGIGPKVWYLQNQHVSLNRFQFFELKIRRNKKVMAILSPGIQPILSSLFVFKLILVSKLIIKSQN